MAAAAYRKCYPQRWLWRSRPRGRLQRYLSNEYAASVWVPQPTARHGGRFSLQCTLYHDVYLLIEAGDDFICASAVWRGSRSPRSRAGAGVRATNLGFAKHLGDAPGFTIAADVD